MATVTKTKFGEPGDPFHPLMWQATTPDGVPVIFVVPQDALSISANMGDVNLDVLSDEALENVVVAPGTEQVAFMWDANAGFVRQ